MADAHAHLVFACGSSLYAVPADTASEVVNVPTLTRVPGAPAHLLGVFAHRGEVLPVVDLTRLTGHPVDELFKRAVLVRTPKGAVALTATRVLGVSTLEGTFERLGDVGVHQHLWAPRARPPARWRSSTPRPSSSFSPPQGEAIDARGRVRWEARRDDRGGRGHRGARALPRGP